MPKALLLFGGSIVVGLAGLAALFSMALGDAEDIHRQEVAGQLEGFERGVVEAARFGVEGQGEGGDLHATPTADRRACPVFRLDSARDPAT